MPTLRGLTIKQGGGLLAFTKCFQNGCYLMILTAHEGDEKLRQRFSDLPRVTLLLSEARFALSLGLRHHAS